MDRDALVAALEEIVAGSVGLTTRALSEAAPGEELTLPQWRALFIVGTGDDGARVGEVAARVGATIPATGRLLRRLERRGLLTLARDERDRRATRVRLTEGGTAVRTSILDFRRTRLAELAGPVEASGFSARAGSLAADRTVAAIAAALGEFA